MALHGMIGVYVIECAPTVTRAYLGASIQHSWLTGTRRMHAPSGCVQVLGDVHIIQELCIGIVFFISGLVLNTQELKKVREERM